MRWIVFKSTLRHSWQPTFLWGLGLGAMMVFTVSLTPVLEGMRLVELFEDLPKAILAAAGLGDDISLLATPEGLIGFGFFSKFALIFAVYPVVMGLRVTANEEDDGILDNVLSLPIPRRQVMLERFLAYAVNIIFLVLMLLGGLYLGTLSIDLALDVPRLVAMTANLFPVLVFVLAFTIFVGALISRKQRVLVIVTAFVVGSFILQLIGGLVETTWMDVLEMLSFFNYYNVQDMLESGISVPHIITLLTLTVIFIAGGLVAFEGRDIAT